MKYLYYHPYSIYKNGQLCSKFLQTIAVNISNILPPIFRWLSVHLEHRNDHDLGKAMVERCAMISLRHHPGDTTYFCYNGNIYEQSYGMAMGSPLLAVLAHLFMEEFEKEALATAPHPPKFWSHCGDELFQHTNKQHDSIKFAIEQESDDNSLPMIDIRMIREDNRITRDIYRKETHTDHNLYQTVLSPPSPQKSRHSKNLDAEQIPR